MHLVTDGFDDNRGTSLVLLNTQKGAEVFGKLKCRKKEVSFDEAIKYNKAWMDSYPRHKNREKFFREYSCHPDDFEKFAEE